MLRVVSNQELDQQAQAAQDAKKRQRGPVKPPDLGNYIRQRWQIMRNHRNQGDDPLNERLLRAQRAFEGKYDVSKIHEIERFGGSKVYARITASKCRGATALLRDVYLGPDKPWDIQPQPDPPVPPEIQANIVQLVQVEVQTLQQAGKPVIADQTHTRYMGLMHAATVAARRNAMQQADATTDKIEDILVEGEFYKALGSFLTDLPLFPFACIKGPVVRMVPKLTWTNNKPNITRKAVMFWERVSPFDIYWSPGVSEINDGEIIERKRWTRADLNDLLGLPGYDQDAIRAALDDYALGLRDWMDAPDTEQALNEGRENPTFNQSNIIDALEYHGPVQGQMLLDQGVDPKLIKDPDRDYMVQSWVVGRHTIKTQLNPSPRQRMPYFVTSFDKVPGTVTGHALPDLLSDLQEIGNATLRSMINNMAMSSGPQVVVNDDVLSPVDATKADELYPWKRWHVISDPLANNREPITFFQPQSNVGELMQLNQSVQTMADEQSGIPRYLTGNSLSGGAGRTASGLSMLMGNAEKVLQTVCGNIDVDVMTPLLEALYDMIMLTDASGLLTGEEQIRVRGVNVALQQETQRQKQLQFLQITANPIDQPIVGTIGRARVLRAVAQGMGLPDDIVPDDQALQQQEDAQKQLQAAQIGLQAHGMGAPGQPPGPPGAPGQAQGPAQNGVAGAQAQGNQAPQPGPPAHSDNAPPVNSFQPTQGIPG